MNLTPLQILRDARAITQQRHCWVIQDASMKYAEFDDPTAVYFDPLGALWRAGGVVRHNSCFQISEELEMAIDYMKAAIGKDYLCICAQGEGVQKKHVLEWFDAAINRMAALEKKALALPGGNIPAWRWEGWVVRRDNHPEDGVEVMMGPGMACVVARHRTESESSYCPYIAVPYSPKLADTPDDSAEHAYLRLLKQVEYLPARKTLPITTEPPKKDWINTFRYAGTSRRSPSPNRGSDHHSGGSGGGGGGTLHPKRPKCRWWLWGLLGLGTGISIG